MNKAIKFPQDEQAHKLPIEWWYFNGFLEDDQKNQYAFMDCLFKLDVPKAGLPLLRKIPLTTAYSSHSILSEIKPKKFRNRIDLVSMVSSDSFKKPLLFINYADPLLFDGYFNSVVEETERFKYRIKTEMFDLKLESTKPPLLASGKGFIDFGKDSTYYYSLTNLKTEGVIRIKDKEIKVKGKSWMDHQWIQAKYSKTKWNWFSLQLDNNVEIMCFEYFGQARKRLANISFSDGRQECVGEIKITPLSAKWKSLKTKAEYPLAWRIEIPSLGADLETEALVENQEMLFGVLNYWEGPLKVSGRFKNERVSGRGFMELFGYPSQYRALDFFKEKISDNLKKSITLLKKARLK